MKYLLVALTFFLFDNSLFGQDIPFNLEYIGSDYTDTLTKKSIVVVLAVTPKKEKDFRPILSMKFSYGVNTKEIQTTMDMQKQKENKVSIVIYGNNVKEKDAKIYTLIEGKMPLNDKTEVMFLAFYMKNISETPIDEMTIKYGLWEKRNQNKRTEKLFNFKVKQ
jgi:hypothetical protein